jgi:hypothetical protein
MKKLVRLCGIVKRDSVIKCVISLTIGNPRSPPPGPLAARRPGAAGTAPGVAFPESPSPELISEPASESAACCQRALWCSRVP